MDRRSLLKSLSIGTAGAVFSLGFSSLWAAIANEGEAEWGYGEDNGPGLWSELSPDFGVCTTGQQQSPIDLHGAIPADLSEIQLSYQEVPLRLVNNGHTLQINIDPGNQLILDGQTFELLQFHFHHPSEHTINHRHHLMEAHFVHRNNQGEYAVLGVFMQEGEENRTLQPIWDAMPAVEGPEQTIAGVKVDINQLLPTDQTTYRYFGSLTTPPCSEVVRWIVFQQPVEVSNRQIEKFTRNFHWNARTIQPINERLLQQSS